MKKYYVIIVMLLIICIAGNAVIMIMSPDEIPLHYNFKGEIDRWGSKYENLLFPIITVLIGVLLIVSAKAQRKKAEASNEKVVLIAGIFTIAFFTLMTVYLGIKALVVSSNESGLTVPGIGRFIGIAIGILLCLLGNIMPKVRKNSVFGLRTKWSMANDRVWQKSQRFCGITSFVCGVCDIIASIFLPDMWILVTLIAFTAVFIVLCIIASYRYYKNDIKSNSKGEDHNA